MFKCHFLPKIKKVNIHFYRTHQISALLTGVWRAGDLHRSIHHQVLHQNMMATCLLKAAECRQRRGQTSGDDGCSSEGARERAEEQVNTDTCLSSFWAVFQCAIFSAERPQDHHSWRPSWYCTVITDGSAHIMKLTNTHAKVCAHKTKHRQLILH